MTPEGKVKAKLKAALDKNFPDHYRFMPVQTGYGAKTLDFLLCIKGLFVAIETKAEGKDLTSLQRSTVMDMLNAGALVFQCDSDEGIENLIARLHLEMKFNVGCRNYKTPLQT